MSSTWGNRRSNKNKTREIPTLGLRKPTKCRASRKIRGGPFCFPWGVDHPSVYGPHAAEVCIDYDHRRSRHATSTPSPQQVKVGLGMGCRLVFLVGCMPLPAACCQLNVSSESTINRDQSTTVCIATGYLQSTTFRCIRRRQYFQFFIV